MSESRRVKETTLGKSRRKRGAAPSARVVFDFESGAIHDLNSEFERVVGYRRDEVRGKTLLELGVWETSGDRDRLLEALSQRGRLEGYELALRAASGRELDVLASIRTTTVRGRTFLIADFTDITDEKREERQFALLRRSIDMHYDGVYWTNTDNEFVYVNEAGCRELGYERDELIGKPLKMVNVRATPKRMEKVWKKLRADGFLSAESVHRRKDRSEFPVEISSSYIALGEREFNCSFVRDLSERRQREEERARLTEQHTEAQKMEAIGRLAGGVAHNFNNILTALIGYCELLLARLPEDSDYRPDAEQIRRAADQARVVTRDLLIFGRRQAGKPAKLDLNTIIVQTRMLLQQVLSNNIEIANELAPTVALVRADHSQIEQVLVNLVMNASDAMPAGGVITLRTADVEVDGELRDGRVILGPGRYVALTVKDTGTGMDEATLERVFEPFFSTKSPEVGSGLGLSTAYGIIEEAGGEIAVESTPNEGTRFTIYLPAVSGSDRTPNPAAG